MKRITKIAVAAVTLSFGLALALPAEAHERRDRRHRLEHRDHRHHEKQHKRFDRYERRHREQRYDHRFDRRHRHDRRYRFDRFDVPHRIRHHRRDLYRPYFEGTVYFAPHRHRHSVYLFPVRIGGVWTYREHYYCDDALFLDYGRFEYHGPRFSIRIGR
ncbi:MAG: hypothetical protein GTN89_07730 [Acidobacteria bacterium]|nr:hypothetical protein [Acidobacteriota bacterium]NIM64222.1 hypothetical protein [Acidobacteriota bacterium]NIO59220.1 hypothetical protein [Acidobacteriota bacterium]NIQ30247.1 hypothetical protein [Acidobacteriota bacterium]NIQ85175.1 hypothetical protein [Acidobacteriota bacterium]